MRSNMNKTSKARRSQSKSRLTRFDFQEMEKRCLLASVVFDDALQNGFQNWSWGTTVDLENTSHVHSGTDSIAATFDEAWSGLYLGNGNGISFENTEEVKFWIRGGNSDQQLRVSYADSNFDFVVLADVIAVAGQWSEFVIDVEAATAPNQIHGLIWQEFSGTAGNTFYLDTASTGDFLPDDDGGPLDGPTITVDSSLEVREISDDIYGLNFADEQLADDIALPVDRWGGNSTTRFNWQLDSTNLASDWYFENYPNNTPDPSTLPFGSTSDLFVEKDRRVGADTIFTIGTSGWTAGSRDIIGAFDVNLYGAQQDVDPWRPQYGNGVLLNGDYVVGNDPYDTSIPSDPAFAQSWINHLTSQFGTADNGGVKYYALDNEPMLWNSTHRDVHPEPASYDEVFNSGATYAAAIKQADPNAQVLGPTVWGWSAYFYSALDISAGGAWWNNPQDRNAHGGEAFIPWYLGEMADAEAQTGQRLLDYLDIHYYPQAPGIALSGAGNADTQETRLESTRSLWDPTYVDESWINEEVQLIPRMRDWIDTHYPGTKLAITEYNWGANDHINGAVAQADVLGIFGREGVDLATMWAPPSVDDPTGFAFRMYRNYDGMGSGESQFGDMGVAADSTDESQVSVFAATRDSDNKMTVMLVNKSTDARITSLDFAQVDNAIAEVYSYSSEDLAQIVQEPDLTLVGGEADITLPGYSITLLEIPVGITEVELPAATVAATAGNLGGGDVSGLEFSDNVDYSLRRSPTSVVARTQFVVNAVSPILNPTTFEFTLEGSVFARTTVNQTIELYDYDANAWESVDTRAATRFTDSIATFSATGNLSRFVDSDGDVEARVTFQSQNPRQQFTSNTDQAFWSIVG